MNDFDPNRFGLDDDPPTLLRCSECGVVFSTDDYTLEEHDYCPECPESEATELNLHE